MFRETLFFTSPAFLSIQDKQLKIRLRETQVIQTKCIEDLGMVVLESQSITITQAVLGAFAAHKVIVVICDRKKMPAALQFPLDMHTMQRAILEKQLRASRPLQKQLWKQLIQAKIQNQTALLQRLAFVPATMPNPKKVQVGDIDNQEAQASRVYWNCLWGFDFKRDRYGFPPNNLLNYGYILLRAATARALVGAGLLPILGIHHHNQYNSFCLADDLMEPYRPFVDDLVYELFIKEQRTTLDVATKARLLTLLQTQVKLRKTKTNIQIALQKTATSFAQCLADERRKLCLPQFIQ